MPLTCSKCSRLNPADAAYCYFDGAVLAGRSDLHGPVNVGNQLFHNPFVFPSGLTCRNFDQLALACQENWPVALEMLQEGYLESFLGSLGRIDLARVAREAARGPDRNRGLDQFLAKLPTGVIEAPHLRVELTEINLGLLNVGEDRHFEVTLENQGMRLLYGSATCIDCVWLSLGDASGIGQKVFEFHGDYTLPVYVRGKYLRAGAKPLEGRIALDTSGGKATVTVRVEVPVKPFPMGVLQGAISPRQIAEKAKVSPHEAAVLMENGAVARWYRENGWTYPVQGPAASGLGAVQQFFEALGLTAPPKVDISELSVQLHGQPGEMLQHELVVKAREKRPVFAHATSDRQWLEAGRARLQGRAASIPLVVPTVPNQPGETLHSRVLVTANGNQRFSVAVSLTIGDGVPRGRVVGGWDMTAGKSARAVLAMPEPVASVVERHSIAVAPPPRAPIVLDAAVAPPPVRSAPVIAEATEKKAFRRIHLLPVLLLSLGLLAVIIHDALVPREIEPATEANAAEIIDGKPYLALAFHDHPIDVKLTEHGSVKSERAGDNERMIDAVWEPSMRFGLRTTSRSGGNKRLTYSEDGETNNTCLQLDGKEYLFGEKPFRKSDGEEIGKPNPGYWEKRDEPFGKHGKKSVWVYDSPKVRFTQVVEIVPGDAVFDKDSTQPVRHLDTCLVRYTLENRDTDTHSVGLRFLLDTFIGSNDGVPFLIPSTSAAPELCDTMREFDSASSVPDYLQALEHDSLEHPGTIARLQLKGVEYKVGGYLEAPSRVTLGAYPDPALSDIAALQDRYPDLARRCRQEKTMWDVPVLPIKSIRSRPDSAVTMYWPAEDLPPGKSREVGFAYGLGSVSSSAGGDLALTAGGNFQPDGEFTLTALVRDPRPGQTVTLILPQDQGFQLLEGDKTQTVPPLSQMVSSRTSPVTWRIKAPPQSGTFTLKVTTSTGISQTERIRISPRPRAF